MNDWEQFLNEVPWFLGPADSATVSTSQPWTGRPIDGLPQLSGLLATATTTSVSVRGDAFELLAWGSPGQRRGWLCYPPRDGESDRVTQTHKSFWNACGGIVERFGEPTTWWTNQDEVLTIGATRIQIAAVLDDYAWLWNDEAMEVTIDPDEYYAVAAESNVNLTLAHRDTGRVLLFAPDHAFSGVTPLTGSPPYSLLTIDDVPDLSTWIEACAAAWR